MNQTSSQTLFFVSHLSLHLSTFRHDPWLGTREFSRCLSGLGWQISFALRGNKSSHGKSNKLSFRFWLSAVFRDFLHHSVQGYVTHQTFPPLFLVVRFMLGGLRSFVSLKLTLLGWCLQKPFVFREAFSVGSFVAVFCFFFFHERRQPFLFDLWEEIRHA